MNNKEQIKNVYDEIHASDALFRKVKNMNKKESKTRNIVKFAATAAAGLALMLATSNGICYAATGETLTTKVKYFINGIEQEADIDWKQDGDVTYGEFELEVNENDDVHVEVTDEIMETTVTDSEE
ncbi:MAG: hypothetical protein IJ040_07555 [Lachnospiraceae bacterium]|nr:hypothetical protein [Lachnospiraceae bacterium]